MTRVFPLAFLMVSCLFTGILCAQTPTVVPDPVDRQEPLPDELEGVGITEHLEAQVPLDLKFKDERGNIVQLRDYFKKDRPVILTLNYYMCPMLCTLQLNGLIEGLKNMEWVPGNQFEIVTVSINPAETPSLAQLKKQNYMKEYGRPAAAQGWHFLTGQQENIKKLADTVGFGYRFDEQTMQYAHAAALFILTPDGKISRYLYGIQYDAQTLRLSLVEASEGKVGSTLDYVLLTCFHYSATEGRYAIAAVGLMRIGGALTVIILGIVLLSFWLRDARRKNVLLQEPHP